MPGARISPEFFARGPVECARELIGCRFQWHGAAGRIVETEAYSARGDPACHTFFRPSARQFVAEHPPGTAYVYLNYGVHWMFNVLTRGPAGPGFVLFRALDPLEGVAEMRRRRGQEALDALCSGPGKLTQALGIDGTAHRCEFLAGPECGLFRGRKTVPLAARRVGIRRATELPWRFVLAGSAHLSRPPGREG